MKKLERYQPGSVCGAKTKSGTTCQCQDLLRGGRCRSHGGLSTGPKSLEGRKRSALNIGKDYLELLAIKQARLGMGVVNNQVTE